MTTTDTFSVYQAGRQLRSDLAELDGGANPQELINYFADQLVEAAINWLNDVETIRRVGAEIRRDVRRTLDLLDRGYGVDVSNGLGQRAGDYNAAVNANRDLAHRVTRAGTAVFNALGRKDAVQELVDEFAEYVFASVKAAS